MAAAFRLLLPPCGGIGALTPPFSAFEEGEKGLRGGRRPRPRLEPVGGLHGLPARGGGRAGAGWGRSSRGAAGPPQRRGRCTRRATRPGKPPSRRGELRRRR